MARSETTNDVVFIFIEHYYCGGQARVFFSISSLDSPHFWHHSSCKTLGAVKQSENGGEDDRKEGGGGYQRVHHQPSQTLAWLYLQEEGS
ncbi:hypothetical protein SLE2022_268300 [Rubroshorea leprosula]